MRDDRRPLDTGLGDQHSIEWVGMVEGQTLKRGSVLEASPAAP